MARNILIVDDEELITSTLANLLEMSLPYSVITVNDPRQALEMVAWGDPAVDLIISDFLMPQMNGLEFLKRVKEKRPETILILLTGYADKDNVIRAINEISPYYYLEKPWDNESLLKIVQNGMEQKELKEDLKQKYEELENSHQEIARLYSLLQKDFQQEVDNVKNLIIAMANIIEAKDAYTDGHTRRVSHLSRRIGEQMGFDPERIRNLEIAGIIHDIGKVGIPEHILNKPAKLTAAEFEVIKKHPAVGEVICKPLQCLQMCLDPIRHHHEKLDGSGYPDGLAGEMISLDARILAIADVFDALYSKRPYRDKLPLPEVRRIMEEEAAAGKIDPALTRILFDLLDEKGLEEILE